MFLLFLQDLRMFKQELYIFTAIVFINTILYITPCHGRNLPGLDKVTATITDLASKDPRRVKRAHSSVPVSGRIGHPLKPSRLSDPFWSNHQNDRLRRLMQFLQGNFPRNLNFVRNQEFVIRKTRNPDEAQIAHGTTTPTVPSTGLPFFKFPTTLIPALAITGTLTDQTSRISLKAERTTENPLTAVSSIENSIVIRNKSKNKTQNPDGSVGNMPSQHIDTSLVSPSGTLIMRVFNNFLVFHQNSEETTTPQAVISTTEQTSTTKDSLTTPPVTTTTDGSRQGTPARGFVSIVRNVDEMFCKICEQFGHQWKELCQKKNCIVPSKPTPS